MCMPYPEGEVFFRRSLLKVNEIKGKEYTWSFDPEKAEDFRSHILIEYIWNRSSPSVDDIKTRRTVSKKAVVGDFSGYYPGHLNVMFSANDTQTSGEGHSGVPVTKVEILNPNASNEYYQRAQDGVEKVVIAPVPVPGGTKYLWVDMEFPIRAIYLPLVQHVDTLDPDLCTYIMIDFRHRKGVQMWFTDHWNYPVRRSTAEMEARAALLKNTTLEADDQRFLASQETETFSPANVARFQRILDGASQELAAELKSKLTEICAKIAMDASEARGIMAEIFEADEQRIFESIKNMSDEDQMFWSTQVSMVRPECSENLLQLLPKLCSSDFATFRTIWEKSPNKADALAAALASLSAKTGAELINQLGPLYSKYASPTDEEVGSILQIYYNPPPAEVDDEVKYPHHRYQRFDYKEGLGLQHKRTLRIDIQEAYNLLILPRQVRCPTKSLYKPFDPEDTIIKNYPWSIIGSTGMPTIRAWQPYDYAAVISKHFGVDLTWQPFKPKAVEKSTISKIFNLGAGVGLGLVPGIGPLLSTGYGLFMEIIDDPAKFKAENIFALDGNMVSTLTDSAINIGKNMVGNKKAKALQAALNVVK